MAYERAKKTKDREDDKLCPVCKENYCTAKAIQCRTCKELSKVPDRLTGLIKEGERYSVPLEVPKRGCVSLSGQEASVIRTILRGAEGVREVARELDLPEFVIRSNLTLLRGKYGCSNSQLREKAAEIGWRTV